MRRAVFLVLSTTLILCTNYGARAQVETSASSSLVLVKGDTPNSCSFVSITELEPVDIVQNLLFVQPGDPPDLVEGKMRFAPDQPYSTGVLQWTAVQGGNYVRAVVNFRNQQAATRSFTMATNYKQPNEKQCQWVVRDAQQETQQNPPSEPLIPNNPTNPTNQVNQNRSGTTRNGTLVGGNVTYPYGSRINADGIISTPRGERTIPSNTVKHGDGSTSYYRAISF